MDARGILAHEWFTTEIPQRELGITTLLSGYKAKYRNPVSSRLRPPMYAALFLTATNAAVAAPDKRLSDPSVTYVVFVDTSPPFAF